MIKFAYNNTKNISTGYLFFKLNYNYYLYMSYEDEVNSYLRFYSINKLAKKLRNLILIYQQNLLYTQ